MTNNYPVGNDGLVDEVAEKLDEIGTTDITREFSQLQPIADSQQYAKAGDETQYTQYVGHVAYSSDFDCLVYQSARSRENVIREIDGNGISISKHIYDTLVNKYDVQYVMIGFRASKDVNVIPINAFDETIQYEGYDEQIYATLRTDVEYQFAGEMNNIFSDRPADLDDDEKMTMLSYKMMSQRVKP